MTTAGTVRYAITRPGPVMGHDEPVSAAVRRITVRLLAGAGDELRAPDDLDRAVHEARKKLKRARAIIRLVRDGAGRYAYREVNVVLRDTARRLGPARDAAVLRETLRRLIATYGDLLAPEPFAATDRYLEARHRAALDRVDRQLRTECITALGTTRARIGTYDGWRAPDAFSSIRPGLHRVYRRGRRGFRRSMATQATPDLHEWRKRVKYLRYQMEAFAELNRPLLGAEATALDQLGETLGIDHDLGLLGTLIATDPAACPDERERWLLVALAYASRSGLQSDAFRLGAAVYSERPRAFGDRIGGYWESAGRALTA